MLPDHTGASDLRSIIYSDIPRKYILPEHQISAASSHRIQFPHDNALQFCGYFPALPVHRETVLPSPAETLHNTDRLHNAYDPHPTVSFPSEDKEGYHEAFHPPHRYNERHWSLQEEYPFPDASGEAADSHSAAPGFHDPEVPERNYPFQKYAHTGALLLLHPHTILW